MTCHCAPAAAVPEYYVVMEDFGRRGRQGQPDPELTRRNIVDRIREKQYGPIAFIHHIHADGWDDVTEELLREAGFYDNAPITPFDRLTALLDHQHDHRKHERA